MPNDHDNGEAGGRVEYLDHTADAMFRAYGRTLEESFAAAAHALCGLMWVPEAIAPAKSHPVDVTGNDLPQLLVAFLEEILFRLDAEGFLTREAAELKIEQPGIRSGDESVDTAGSMPQPAFAEAASASDAPREGGPVPAFRLTAVLRGDLLEPRSDRLPERPAENLPAAGAPSAQAPAADFEAPPSDRRPERSAITPRAEDEPPATGGGDDSEGDDDAGSSAPPGSPPSQGGGAPPIAPPRYSTHGDVKAVTYNQIRVERDPDNRHWMVQAVVDM